MRETSVLIVGGGPVGLSAAVCLGRMGVPCVVVERDSWVTDHPKARGLHIRTMELFRQWGIEGEARRRGLPEGAGRFIYCTTLEGPEIGRTVDPGWNDQISPSGRVIVSQDVVEELLLEAARAYSGVNVMFSALVENLRQADDGVTSTVRHTESGETEEIGARFAIAADGAGSTVRHMLGVEMDGPGLLGWFASIYYRADLSDLVAHRPAAAYFTFEGAQSTGGLFSVNGTDRWITIHRLDGGEAARPSLPPEEQSVEMVRRLIGRREQPVEILDTMIWGMGAKVAREFRVGRVFLAGDAAHRLPPTGGFGMNSGIQDVHNLAWKLAMVLRGEASESLLATYHHERYPVAQANIAWSLVNARRFGTIAEAVASGDLQQLENALADQQNHLQPDGQDLGFSYEQGALLADGSPAVPWGGRHYDPSDRPGSRYPHGWLDTGEGRISTLDLFDTHFTLLAGSEAKGIADAGREIARSLPLTVHQLQAEDTIRGAAAQAGGAVLVRPDGHVAWRVMSEPGDPAGALRAAFDDLLRAGGRKAQQA